MALPVHLFPINSSLSLLLYDANATILENVSNEFFSKSSALYTQSRNNMPESFNSNNLTVFEKGSNYCDKNPIFCVRRLSAALLSWGFAIKVWFYHILVEFSILHRWYPWWFFLTHVRCEKAETTIFLGVYVHVSPDQSLCTAGRSVSNVCGRHWCVDEHWRQKHMCIQYICVSESDVVSHSVIA